MNGKLTIKANKHAGASISQKASIPKATPYSQIATAATNAIEREWVQTSEKDKKEFDVPRKMNRLKQKC